jgi:hypothetical protein
LRFPIRTRTTCTGEHNFEPITQFAFKQLFFRISKRNRRTLRCKTRSARVVMENLNCSKKPQKERPKRERGKNQNKTDRDPANKDATERTEKYSLDLFLTDQWSTQIPRQEEAKPQHRPGVIDRKKQIAFGKLLIGTLLRMGKNTPTHAGTMKTCPCTLQRNVSGPIRLLTTNMGRKSHNVNCAFQ